MRTKLIFDKLYFALEQMLNLFYPNLCILCESRTHSTTEIFCLDCQYHVHPTRMHLLKENEFTAHFRGRIDLVNGAALYYYVKGGRVQKALELLKYKNRPDIGIRFGQFFGKLLKENPDYHSINIIIPVPLHPSRKNQRGYNQSFMIACGIVESLHAGIREDIIKRKIETLTQTERNRMERAKNMQDVFQMINPKALEGKHVLLVDDILTTGATLEACGRLIQQVKDVRISMVSLAMAS